MEEKKNLFFKRHETLFKFIISYSLILFIPLVFGFYVYRSGVDLVSEDTHDINLSLLNQTQYSVVNKLEEIEQIGMQLANSKRLAKYSAMSQKSSELVLGIADCIGELQDTLLSRNIIANSYVYFPKTDFIFNQSTLYSTELYYKRVLNYDTDQYERWKETLTKEKIVGRYIDMDSFIKRDETNPYISYVIGIPIDITKELTGVLILNIKKSSLLQDFTSTSHQEDTYSFIIDEDNHILVGSNLENEELNNQVIENAQEHIEFKIYTIDNRDWIFISSISNYNGWTYTYIKPENVVYERLNKFKDLYVLVILVSTLLGVSIAIYISYKNTKPLDNITQKLAMYLQEEHTKERGKAYSIIDSSVSKLILANQSLESGIREQMSFVQSAFAVRLLRGLIYSEQDAMVQANYLGIKPKGNLLFVILFRIDNQSRDIMDNSVAYLAQQGLFKNELKQHITAHIKNILMLHDLDHRTLAVIISTDLKSGEKKELYGRDLATLIKTVGKDSQIRFSIGVGESFHSIHEIWYSFYQAQQCLEFSSDDKPVVLFYKNLPLFSESSYYPIEVEQHLVNSIKANEYENIVVLLDTIYKENFEKRALPPKTAKELVIQLKNTVSRSLDQNNEIEGIDSLMNKISDQNEPSVNFKFLKQVYRVICTSANKGKQTQPLMNEIKQYIEENYMMPDLCLSMISLHFKLSEGYFSYLFKEQTQISFSDYVEQLRIQKACTLLSDSKLNINEISLLVGYNSAQSFRRAFKRVMGVNPTDMRT